jgi:hypothetical protein
MGIRAGRVRAPHQQVRQLRAVGAGGVLQQRVDELDGATTIQLGEGEERTPPPLAPLMPDDLDEGLRLGAPQGIGLDGARLLARRANGLTLRLLALELRLVLRLALVGFHDVVVVIVIVVVLVVVVTARRGCGPRRARRRPSGCGRGCGRRWC